MDNAQKAIMIGVGLFITIIVIAAVMLITGIGQDLLNSGTEQMSNITSGLEEGMYDQLLEYNGTPLRNSQIKQLVRQYQNDSLVTITVPNYSTKSVWTCNVTGSASTGITVTFS